VDGNAARVRDSVGDWNEGGLRALSDGWWAEDIVWHDWPQLPDPVTVHGREAVEARIGEMVAAMGHWCFEIKDLEDHGEFTLSELQLVGKATMSETPFSGTIHQVIRWRDGRVAEVFTFSDRDQATGALSTLSAR
jgi:ketosteroid isomerase-like protein